MWNSPGVVWTDAKGQDIMVSLTTRLLKDRIILLEGEINSEMAMDIVAQLHYLESENKDKVITMLIQSPGGEVAAGYSIIDTIHNITCPVHTVATGMVASMATTIFLNGKKGERTMYKHSELLVHQPLGGCKGQISDMERNVNHGIRLKKQLAKEYSELTGINLSDMEKMMDRDTILTSKEALKLGLCDKIK